MKRNKEWWNKFNAEDRYFIWHYERSYKKSSVYGEVGGYLLDDCTECVNCGNPIFGSGNTCTYCNNEYYKLTEK